MNKPWLLWTHDPCPEGGWHISGEFDTKEQAIEAAKKLDADAEKRHQEMVEFCKQEDPARPWRRGDECYDGCMVTPNEVFKIQWNTTQDVSSER
jgi:hypothetical protein